MKKSQVFFSLFLIAVVFFVEFDLARRMNSKASVKSDKRPASIAPDLIVSDEMVIESPAGSATENEEISFFESKTLKEAQKLSQLQNNPKSLDEKMDKLAAAISPLEIKRLAIVIRSAREDGDRRAMAIELLSRSKTQDGMDVLKDFVVSRQNSQVTPRAREFESVLRAQAVEGIAAFPQKQLALSYLNSMSKQVDESFLKDRISHSEEGLRGRDLHKEDRDKAVLKQLVE